MLLESVTHISCLRVWCIKLFESDVWWCCFSTVVKKYKHDMFCPMHILCFSLIAIITCCEKICVCYCVCIAVMKNFRMMTGQMFDTYTSWGWGIDKLLESLKNDVCWKCHISCVREQLFESLRVALEVAWENNCKMMLQTCNKMFFTHWLPSNVC